MTFLVTWVLLAAIVAVIASQFHRRKTIWFVASCLFSPLVTAIVLALVGIAYAEHQNDPLLNSSDLNANTQMKNDGALRDSGSEDTFIQLQIELLSDLRELFLLGVINEQQYLHQKTQLIART